jgi:hypothetical protein
VPRAVKLDSSPRRPDPHSFIDFRLCKHDPRSHPAFAWMLRNADYRKAEATFKASAYYVGMAPGKKLAVESGTVIAQPGMQEIALVEFAQRISYCLGHFFEESASDVWAGSHRNRQRAARDYGTALRWLQKGYGPYGRDSKAELAQLLTATSEYLRGLHLSKGMRIKGGSTRTAGVFIRELAVYLQYFDLSERAANSIVSDVLILAGAPAIDPKTIGRHVKAAIRDAA